MARGSFDGLRVLTLETRRSAEIGLLVTSHGGQPVPAPALREVPLGANPEVLAFAEGLVRGEFDLVVLLTGVGTRLLVDVVEGHGDRAAFLEALGRVRIAARGPKPVAALRALGLAPWVTAPEPNTWPDLMLAIEDAAGPAGLAGLRVAVQEYGVPSQGLIEAFEQRGARVTRVPVYRWALPENLAPLEAAVDGIAGERLDVVLFTTQIQVVHLLQVAEASGKTDAVRQGLRRMVVASIGPTTSEALRQAGIEPDLEPVHPKMGFLVNEAATHASGLLAVKRSSSASPA